jgi:predicted phage-related endonuclease
MAKITKAQAETKIERYLELQALIKEASKEADALKAELKELAEGTEARTYVAGDHSVSVTTATRKNVDAKALAAAHPKIAAKFTKETWYDTVRIK